jgi:hypothetical protein
VKCVMGVDMCCMKEDEKVRVSEGEKRNRVREMRVRYESKG